MEWFKHFISLIRGNSLTSKSPIRRGITPFYPDVSNDSRERGVCRPLFNDVTELGLLKLYDTNAVEREELVKDEKMVMGLLEMAMRSGAKVKVHNLYKGLSIANEGLSQRNQ
jgi:hypothetical protein